MAFQTIISTETTDKNEMIARQVADWMSASPENTVFYIVPDHIKFTAELEMIRRVGALLQPNSESFAVTRLQVYSFTRLAWYFLREHPVIQRQSLSSVGMAMLLQKILSEHQDDLILFRQEARHKGFIERLSRVMQELHQGGIEVEDFSTFFDMEKPSEVEQRLREFGLIYRFYLKEVGSEFVSSDTLLQVLAAHIQEIDLSKTLVVVDQWYALSAQELEVLEALSKVCHQVEFHTTLTIHALREKGGLFDSNRALVRRLLSWLMIDGDDDVVQSWLERDTRYAADFVSLEQFWLETSGGLPSRSGNRSEKEYLEHLHWASYTSESQEIVETLATIKQLVASGRYRYQDIQLLSRSLEQQEAFLRPMLSQYEIPAFIDLSDTMEHHPLIQVLDALYAIWKNYWRYSDIMSLLRSEYTFWIEAQAETTLDEQLEAFRNHLDTTETIILAQGYEGYDWVSGRAWDYKESNLDEETENNKPLSQTEQQLRLAQQLREKIVAVLEPFFKKMEEEQTTKEALTTLYTLLETIGVPQSILYWRNHVAEQGDIEMARRQEQVWHEFLHLMDEFVYIFGETPFDWEIFQLLLHTGFEHTHYHLAPSTLDQLTVTGIDAVRYSPKKVTFVMGLSQGNLPRMEEESGLLTDEERLLLGQQLDSGRFLNPTTMQRQQVEPFLFYKILTSATEELYLSYSASHNGSVQKASSYVERLWEKFDCEKINGAKRQEERLSQAAFVTPFEMFTVLLTQMRTYKLASPETIPVIWRALPHLLRFDESYSQRYRSLVESVFRLNVAKTLPSELAGALYGNQLYLSTSQVEAFYRDPFSHFLQYGLRLQERREFELTAAGAGEYFHEAFDLFIKLLHERQITIKEVDDALITQFLDEIFAQMTQDARFSILQSSPRIRFIQSLLQDTLKKTLQAAIQQLKALQLTPWKTEVQFGSHTQMPVEMPLNDTQQLLLRGKIDRIDLLETPDYITMGIVDYKSSSQKFDINKLEAGIQLQLLTYMMIAKQLVEQERSLPVIPYAGLYMHVHQPNFKQSDIQTLEDWNLKWQKDYRLRGLLTDDWHILQQVEPDFTEGSSLYLPFGKTKKGTYDQYSTVISPEDLDFLMEYAFRQIFKAGERILQGDTTLAPFEELKQFSDSVTGKFSPISQFDATNPENRYRTMHHFKLQQGIDYLKEQGGDTE